MEVVDFPYTTLHEKALLDLTSGTGSYDIIDVASQWDGEFAPYMTDLGPLMEKDGYTFLPTGRIFCRTDFRIHGKSIGQWRKS